MKYIGFVVILLLLSSCGGGGSSNSGAVVAPVAPVILVPNGLYSGTRTFTVSNSVGVLDEATGSMQLAVNGAAGAQQVRIQFLEFSGSSSIGVNQEFSIPSGSFPSPSGQPGVNCTISIVFAGRFIESTATGTEQGTITCPNVGGVLTISGTFEATLSNGKPGETEPNYTTH